MPFRLPTHVTLEPGCLALLPDRVSSFSAQRVLLVCDAGLRQTPWPARLEASLQATGVSVMMFDGIEPNPRHTTVDALVDRARGEEAEVVIGLGGGSVLDAAKAVAMLLRNPGSCLDYEGKNRFSEPAAPFLAIPTTCGTGSEVTWVSVITHATEKRKLSIKGDGMFPTHAFIDADVLTTLPASLVASTGLDALTHALEAYTGTAANPVSDALAEKAVALLLAYLPRAVEAIGTDAEAREAVMRASTLAGIAFGNADVGGVHCLSETIGGLWDVPHGLCNAMLLVPVLRYHRPHIADRLAALERQVASSASGDTATAAGAFLARLERLVATVNLPAFATLGLSRTDFTRIAEGAVANNSNGSNPQPMTRADYLSILELL